MNPKKIFLSAFTALLASPLVFVACSDDHGAPVAGPCANRQLISLPTCPTEDSFSDEACVVFDDRTRNGQISINDMRSPVIQAPSEGQALPSITPFTFRWDAPLALRFQRTPPRTMAVLHRLLRDLSPISEAHAHCQPFTGRAYHLLFRVGAAVVLRRQQSSTTWTPDADTWGRLRTAAGSNTLELTVQTASFSANQVAQTAGPFVQSTPRRFTLAP